MSVSWDRNNIPSQEGKTVIVTGGTGGIGFHTAVALGKAGAKEVIILGRNVDTGRKAVELLKKEVPNAEVSFAQMDLSSLKSIRNFASSFNARNVPLDILVNNAGISAPTSRQVTEDGFEAVFGTNHLGHFALTGLLLPSLRLSSSPRVVSVSSRFSRVGRIDFSDLQSERKPYPGFLLYANAKLANILFTLQLQKISDENGWGITAVAVHPGLVQTGMTTIKEGEAFLHKLYFATIVRVFAQDGETGANSSIFAATSNSALPGKYYGPTGFFGMFGDIGALSPPPRSLNNETAKQLWKVSEELTSVVFDN